MYSSGISTVDNSRIARQTIGTAAGKLAVAELGRMAATSGAAGAAISGGIEVISSGIRLLHDEIDAKEFAGCVAHETVGGGLSAAAGSVAASAASVGTASLLSASAPTAPAWLPAAVGIGTAVTVGNAVKSIFD